MYLSVWYGRATPRGQNPCGFTRVSPPDPSGGEVGRKSTARLSACDLKWLPAIEVYGEGIYLELDEDQLAVWSGQPAVRTRAARRQASYRRMCEQRQWEPIRQITPRLMLTHSLAHILIRQLGVESGYSSASIRERPGRLWGGRDRGTASSGRPVSVHLHTRFRG